MATQSARSRQVPRYNTRLIGQGGTHPDADTLADADPLELLIGRVLHRDSLLLLLLDLKLLFDDLKPLPCRFHTLDKVKSARMQQ